MTAAYSLEDYVADLRRIAAEESDQAALVARLKPLAGRLAEDRSWLRDDHRRVDPAQGFGVHLLHEERDHDLAVFVFAWAPGRGVGAHDHKTWAVVVGLEGEETEDTYRRRDDGSRPGFADLAESGRGKLTPGDVVSCLPDDIHAVRNSGERVSVSLHTYGRHLNHTGRSVFDIAAKTERPLVVKVET